MRRYLVKRFLLMFPTLLGVAVLIFVLMRLLPGDVVQLRMAGEGGFVSEEAMQQERARLGLDRSIGR
ncbi:MAG TPA: ABC transporter permease, partial [Methylomirabilota bacterium]